MRTPDLPPDEPQRLVALRAMQILDTPAEEWFDRITRLARRLFGVPIALVSFVDADRLWFKSCQGLDATEAPRSISFCSHAMLGNEPLIVQDARLAPRFGDTLPADGEFSIRCYARQSLTGRDGHRVGTLSVVHRRPRQVDSEKFEPRTGAWLTCLRPGNVRGG